MPSMQFYPKARQPRPSIHHPSVRPLRMSVLKAAAINGLLLQFLFLGLFCYLFGSLFQQTTHVHNINVLFVDYDGGAVGSAVRAANQQLKSPGFPSLIERPTQDYPQTAKIEHAVCDIKYWAAFYVVSNASDRLTAALGGGSAATAYNQSDVLSLVWNQARYPTVADSAVYESLQSLAQAARTAYIQGGGKRIIQALNSSDPAAIAVFSNPWTLSSINIQPTTQGSRLIYNTLVIILILIQEFFFLGSINGLYQQFRLYTAVNPRRIAIVRQILSGVYTFLGSLCTTGAIWAFRYGWHVNGSQFVLNWMALWLFAHLNFLVLDVFSIWVSPPFVPMALITWIILNVTSILLPFELSPGFYKWGYALPAHSVFQVLIDIWSGGCNPQLGYALPVMFAYEVVALVLSTIGVYRRAHYASIKQEVDEKQLHERVEAAIAEQEERQLERETTRPETLGSETEQEGTTAMPRRGTVTTLEDQEELASRIRREISRPEVDRVVTSRESMGPCFDLAFTK
ncbi:hypothetical protein N7474_001665 [Penicillium riverlandense]|uniref:uncharacterized protein n=1 Tax=Penicillium riverlandense TaxID=1903569 RepID=UPI002548529D|nr:uncharacterized protein N7474_001665 [Penicillium riverlandense]KAJ5833354.1 hypothetical protein N7474_001665 [Penicillium riverlandense]